MKHSFQNLKYEVLRSILFSCYLYFAKNFVKPRLLKNGTSLCWKLFVSFSYQRNLYVSSLIYHWVASKMSCNEQNHLKRVMRVLILITTLFSCFQCPKYVVFKILLHLYPLCVESLPLFRSDLILLYKFRPS